MGAVFYLWQEGLLMALIASLGGCLIRQSTEYKAGHSIKWQIVLMDCFIAIFLGFYAFWFVLDEIKPSLVNACVINIIIGYTGSKVIEIAKSYLIKKSKVYLSVREEKNE